ncbi:helix-turn-helix domain-containing protein [Streptomyces chartreusis]|uniref:helix-turn-helix domain-containing protein n=1 Tax=Streptomyces chartreusis TaxID=1969 RepID=UPI003D902531
MDNWWAKRLSDGRVALMAQPRGRRVGDHQVLDAVEQQALRQTVLDHRPCDLGPAGQPWTRAGVGDLIAKLLHIRRPDLSVEQVATASGISTNDLHRLFRPTGLSFTTWLRRERLARIRHGLQDPAHHQVTGAVARRWGVTDPAHLPLKLRKHYGRFTRHTRQGQGRDRTGKEFVALELERD